MAEAFGIYKCDICGNVVSVVEAHEGNLICCGQKMKLLSEKTAKEEGKEKHVPVVSIEKNKVTVKVGSTFHSMEEKHFIEFIQLIKEKKVIAEKRLYPGQKPEAEFCIENPKGVKVRELCNIHGLWIN